jgi:tetratricopeptide (TPR) repeat protein
VPEVGFADATAAKAALVDLSDSPVRVRAPVHYVDLPEENRIRLARTPVLASEFVDRAEARVVAKDYAGALGDYGDALKLKADDPETLNARCFTRAIANIDLDQALADCNAALGQKPHEAAYLDSRGFTYFRKGAMDKALADLDAALSYAPNQAPTLYVKGLIEQRSGEAAQAKADIAAANTVDPTVATTYAGYGVSR